MNPLAAGSLLTLQQWLQRPPGSACATALMKVLNPCGLVASTYPHPKTFPPANTVALPEDLNFR